MSDMVSIPGPTLPIKHFDTALGRTVDADASAMLLINPLSLSMRWHEYRYENIRSSSRHIYTEGVPLAL